MASGPARTLKSCSEIDVEKSAAAGCLAFASATARLTCRRTNTNFNQNKKKNGSKVEEKLQITFPVATSTSCCGMEIS